MAASQIATRHFGRKVVAALSAKGVRVIGTQALPDAAGCFINSTTGYVVDDNGCGRVWTAAEVRGCAQ